jgi:hypothetical protein
MTTLAPALPLAPAASGSGGIIERLLRDRPGLVDEIAAGRGLAAIARAMLIAIAAGAALFGAAIGLYRGGEQIAYAAVKLPLVLVFTAALGAPALTAFNIALGRPAALRRDLTLVLAAMALGAITLAALAPVVLVARAIDASYHDTALLLAACCGFGGMVSLVFLARALHREHARSPFAAAVLVCGVLAAVGAQAAWTLRPYLVRPRTPDVPFVRDLEGSLLEALSSSAESARGHYRRDHAPLPGETEALP